MTRMRPDALIRRRFDRRAFLRGAGGVAMGLPFLASARARADEGVFPKRLVVWFRPNGTIPSQWFPQPGADERSFTLSRILAPLTPFREDTLFLRGINMDVCALGPGEQHQQGMGGLLTGREIQQGTFVGGDGSLAGWGSGISIDQVIADAVADVMPKASLVLGVRAVGAEVRHRLSYRGASSPLPPENDPAQVYEELFGGLSLDQEALARLRRQRGSVLDAVKRSFKSLRSRVSVEDRRRLDEHGEMVRDLERSLDKAVLIGGQCAVPERPPIIDAVHEDWMDEVSKLQMDLLVTALACDQKRVAVLQYSTAENLIRFPHLESYQADHTLSHSGNSDAVSQEAWTKRQVWYMEQLAYFLGKLKGIPEGAGTMLDNTLVFVASEISVGNTHSHRDMPFLLCGRGGGAVTPGRYVRYTDRQHCDLLVSLLNAMDVEVTTFGHPDYCTGPLSGLA